MNLRHVTLLAIMFPLVWCRAGQPQEVASLRLVPFPKEVRFTEGGFSLNRELTLEIPEPKGNPLAETLADALLEAGFPALAVHPVAGESKHFRLSASPLSANLDEGFRAPSLRPDASDEHYTLRVAPEEIVCNAQGPSGLLHGAATLVQLIRANRQGEKLPCLEISDWPSLRWRCFQDDMTRGPSSTLPTLQFEVALGAELKMNLFTYYMEYQYAFKKHPQIGPEAGSLEPDDLRALVDFAKRRHVDVLGNQQSFGHFSRILKHEEFADLRETPSLLCPAKEGSYQLLDDLYSEVCPLLPFDFFNVCCDETWGLGTGPSKELAGQIGVGGVYVRHIRRVHDLLKKKYGKRMMMWGDIILQHPDELDQIPTDTIMLTWGYAPRSSFEDQILPFAESGYEFFVCPGINNWSRILPDFDATTTNIRNFVRDGAKHGALGMLNTAWEDDGEALQGAKWHGYAWGAECAWNASTTSPEQFNRRLGAVLFGEKGDHFGQAIELLGQTHRLAGMQGMNNRRFWRDDFLPTRSPAAIRKSAEQLLRIVRPAIEHLETCRQEATVNRELLDAFLFGARRMERIGQRMLDGLEAARLYTRAYEPQGEQAGSQDGKGTQAERIEQVEALVKKNRDALDTLRRQFAALWLAESKPYAVDWTLDRYTAAIERYDELLAKLAEARKQIATGDPLPSPRSLGLLIPETFMRQARPSEKVDAPLEPEAPWAEPGATHRVGVVVGAGSVDRFDLPVAVALCLAEGLASKPVRAFCRRPGGEFEEILAQLDPSDKPARTRLTLLIPGHLPQGSEAVVHVYLGLAEPPAPLPEAVTTQDGPDGMIWIENDKARLLLGPEGAHVYRWEVKGLDNRDLTMPGTSDWSGFSDLRAFRHVPHQIECVASGPALVRYRCSTASGMVKWIGLFGGTSWMEVILSDPVGHYWDFDAPANFAGNGPTPGTYLFANGQTGPVAGEGPFAETQVKVSNTHWGLKFNDENVAMGLITPEVAARHIVAPGADSGGVGIENSTPAAHFVTFAGRLGSQPQETMNHLQQTLDLRNQPRQVLYAIQQK